MKRYCREGIFSSPSGGKSSAVCVSIENIETRRIYSFPIWYGGLSFGVGCRDSEVVQAAREVFESRQVCLLDSGLVILRPGVEEALAKVYPDLAERVRILVCWPGGKGSMRWNAIQLLPGETMEELQEKCAAVPDLTRVSLKPSTECISTPGPDEQAFLFPLELEFGRGRHTHF